MSNLDQGRELRLEGKDTTCFCSDKQKTPRFGLGAQRTRNNAREHQREHFFDASLNRERSRSNARARTHTRTYPREHLDCNEIHQASFQGEKNARAGRRFGNAHPFQSCEVFRNCETNRIKNYPNFLFPQFFIAKNAPFSTDISHEKAGSIHP
jgi:hypothetical protein